MNAEGIFTISDGYEPGHVEMFYGNGRDGMPTTLGTLEIGDLMAELTVNGEWSFTIDGTSYDKPHEITPEIEAMIREEFNDNIEWDNNNWFEIFVYEKNAEGKWESTEDYGIWEGTVGPTPDEMRSLLADSIAEHETQKDA